MINEPSLEELGARVDSPYTLVILAARRARHINLGGKHLLDKYNSVKPVSRSLEEIADGKLTYKKKKLNSIK